MRTLVFAAMLALAALGGGAVALVGQRIVAGPGDVRAYLLANPEVIPEAIQRLQDRETGRAIAANGDAVRTPFPGATAGNPAGDVAVVAFMDYACGFCRTSLPELDRAVAADGRVRVVYRELPVLGPASREAALWALAAARQGRFEAFHRAMFAAGRPTQASIAAAARAAGLDIARAQADVAGPEATAEVNRNLALAQVLGIGGTPAWVVGDRVLSGAVGEAALTAAIRDARG